MRKFFVGLGLLLTASLLCSACGLKHDLYLPEGEQAQVSVMHDSSMKA